ncbi:MAG: (Fe-S)-binding protein [Candidatus Omnitrophota bacterium]
MPKTTIPKLPGLNCGLCGYRTCAEMAVQLPTKPELLKRCLPLSEHRETSSSSATFAVPTEKEKCGACDTRCAPAFAGAEKWRDSLGREFDFYLEHFPEEVGPREVILPHNPMITREMDICRNDILIGRPLGMSCGCPITHCGVVMDVDKRTGVMTWCVTGPLQPRQHGYKDIGYYIAEGYEGLIQEARCEIKIGMRYYFQPKLCMLQWRHSGLVNYLNKTRNGLQVRVEGLWIG